MRKTWQRIDREDSLMLTVTTEKYKLLSTFLCFILTNLLICVCERVYLDMVVGQQKKWRLLFEKGSVVSLPSS